MTMPAELSMPVQRVLRTMVSGIMLVQCFTVYVYLAAYIVLLYPVFLEERPTLVLPWLLLAAIRKLLCELTSLALGLGTCVLLGPARPPCIKFVVVKFTSIMPAFYMWMLVFSYYHALKVASAFKTFPAVLPPNDNDYGLELAVRRRRTKSLLGEEQLRKKLVANFYGERTSSITNETYLQPVADISSRMVHSTDTSLEEAVPETDVMKPLTMSTTGWSDIGAYEDWFGSEVMIPRDTDRILEQIVLMLLRIGAYLKKEGIESIIDSQILNSAVPPAWHQRNNIDCATINADDTDTPPLVGSNKGNMASYLREYPQIFMKKQGADIPQAELTIASLKTVHSYVESEEGASYTNKMNHSSSDTSIETIALEVEKVPSKKKITITDNKHEDITDKLTITRLLKSKQLPITEAKKQKTKRKKHLDLESQSKENVSETLHKMKSNEDDKNKFSNSKILNENIINELPQGKISINANSVDSKILKKDKNHEFIQNKLLTNSKTQHSINSTKLNEDKNEESTHSKIIIQDNINEFTQSRTSSNATSLHKPSSKTLNINKLEESIDSKMLKQDSNSAKTQNSNYRNSFQKVRNVESKDSKILEQSSSNKTIQSKISTNATAQVSDGSKIFKVVSKISINSKTKRSKDSKLITEDSSTKLTESKTMTYTKPQLTTNTKTLNKDKAEEYMDRKTLKQDNNNELTQSKISTNQITDASQGSKILKHDNSNELIQSNISTNSKAKSSTDNKIIKQDSINKFVPNEIPTNAKTQNSFNSNKLNDDKCEEPKGFILLKQDSNIDFKQHEISNNAKTQESADSKIMTKERNTEFIKNKLPSDIKPSHTTSTIKILNKDKAEESVDIKILKQDNDKFKNIKISSDEIVQVSNDNKISNKGKNNEYSDSKLLKRDNSDELSQSKISTNSEAKSTKDSKIIKQDSNDEFVPSKTQNLINSNKLNEDSNIESMNNKILKQENKEFTQSKITTYAVAQFSKDSEMLNENKNKKSMDIQLLKEDNSLHTLNQQAVNGNIANVENNNETRLKSDEVGTVAKISLIGEDDESLKTCSCSDINEQNSKAAHK